MGWMELAEAPVGMRNNFAMLRMARGTLANSSKCNASIPASKCPMICDFFWFVYKNMEGSEKINKSEGFYWP
jgi:hypothetical protein